MSDVYARVTALDAAMQERLIQVLETRGADPQQQALRRTFLADIPFPPQAGVLEIGCGVDPVPIFLSKARELAAGLANVTFREADGRSLPFEAGVFDVVVFDSTLSHVPGPEQALAEAFRVLRPQGWLAAFDGDYATTTVALGDHDPLQACADATMANSVTDRWLMRRLPALVRACGFASVRFRSHGFVETTEGGYMLTVVDRGADILHADGQIGDETAAMLKAEARRRVKTGTFFGHIAYTSLVAHKPA
jgi:SAM-dependent methyltransferase